MSGLSWRMAKWLTGIGAFAAGLAAIAESSQKIASALGDHGTLKVFGLTLIFGCAFLWISSFRKLRRQSETHEPAMLGLGVLLASTIALALVATIQNPPIAASGDSAQRQEWRPQSKVAQQDCASGDCGLGGPNVDPEENPQLLRPEDYRSYLESKQKLRSSSFCSISIHQTGPDFFEVKLRLPPGGVCQKFFPLTTSGSTWLTQLRTPDNGGYLNVEGRSFVYVPDPRFRGTERFILKQYSYQNTGKTVETTLRYTVEIAG
jgi:hypothetical protein